MVSVAVTSPPVSGLGGRHGVAAREQQADDPRRERITGRPAGGHRCVRHRRSRPAPPGRRGPPGAPGAAGSPASCSRRRSPG